MSKPITGAEYPLSKIFSSDFDFRIPPYQRPYAWEIDQATVLFDDLYDFWLKEPTDTYFLGSIVLIKEEHKPQADVVDGQQRLTTLTILLSVLTSKLTGRIKDSFEKYVMEPGDPSQALEPKPRLTLRSRDSDFFHDYVQNLKLGELIKLDSANLDNDAKRNIRANTLAIKGQFEKSFNGDAEKLLAFGQFLVQRCFLVAVSTPNEKSAFRVFSVMNSRGMDLLPTDIVKADVIGRIPKAQQEIYNDKWESMEEKNGRDGFNDLFGHVRMLYAQEKARRGLLEEFRSKVIPKASSEVNLIDEILVPYSDAFFTIQKLSYEATKDAETVNTMLKWLHRVNFSDWIPPAIQFLSQHANDPAYCAKFFQKLERLNAYLHITAKNINKRIERYALVLKELEKEGHSFSNPLTSVELSEEEKKEFLDTLDGKVYWLTGIRRNYVMLRLDSFMADGAAFYEPAILTIEHVLPQTVDSNNPWIETWPDEEQRNQWVHRIANLVPLNKQRNSAAQNFDFDKKKSAYFAGRKNVSSYVLTTQVLGHGEWTPAILEDRQKDLMSVLKENWELSNDHS